MNDREFFRFSGGIDRVEEITDSSEFLKAVLDSVTENIAVIDRHGKILFVNQSWVSFGLENQGLINESWYGVNYIEVCDQSAELGDKFAISAAKGIRNLISSGEKFFYLEYPCHSPDEKRWFMMRVTPFSLQGESRYVISHQNITEKKLAEEALLKASRTDGLTGIPNRQFFEDFVEKELRRSSRSQSQVALAMIDIDHFKLLNDTCGHLAGDDCLRRVGIILKKYTQRASDSCARLGGDEFALVLGNTTADDANRITEQILGDIRGLRIANKATLTKPVITASIGLATLCPSAQADKMEFMKAADKLLYVAKENGRNQLVVDFHSH